MSLLVTEANFSIVACPDAPRGEFEAVAGGVAEVEGRRAVWPDVFGFNGDAQFAEAEFPRVELGLFNPEAGVPRTVGAMGREVLIVCPGRRGIEEQKHGVFELVEDVASGIAMTGFAFQQSRIKGLRGVEVRRVEGSFEDMQKAGHN